MTLPFRTFVLVAGAMLSLACVGIAHAQDPAVVNAALVSVKFENDRVRVFEAVLAPGAREALHSHPAHLIHVTAGGTMRNHTADGQTSERRFESGEVFYREPLTHWAENIGDTTVRVLVVELKR